MTQQQSFLETPNRPDASPLVIRLDTFEQKMTEVSSMLERIYEMLEAKYPSKDSYTTTELAKILGRRPYTVREWCRLGRINAYKAECGRGQDEEWRISHTELLRIQNEGLLPG